MMHTPIISTRKPNNLIVVLFVVLVLGMSGLCHAEVVKDTRMALGTTVTVMIWKSQASGDAKQIIDRVFDEIERVESIFSIYRQQSQSSLINANAGIKPVGVSAETFAMLQEGMRLAEISKGAFDITFAGAGKLYHFGDPRAVPPNQEQIDKALENVGIKHLKLDQKTSTAFLDRRGAKIDLGGYIKGYAVDKACEVIRQARIKNFIINAGGDMYVAGAKGQKAWRIGIQNPRGKRDELIAALSVKDQAVVTSGDYERYFIHDGVRYHHILDSRTGLPARLCQSVTIIADSVMAADALATIVFILGPDEGIKLVESEKGASCLIIDADGKRHFSSVFKQSCEFEKIGN